MRRKNKNTLRKFENLLLVSFVFLSACFVVFQVDVKAVNSNENKSQVIYTSESTLGGIFNYKGENGTDVSSTIDYSSNSAFSEPLSVPQTYTENEQSYRFVEWSFDETDVIVNGEVTKSFTATAQYVKTYVVKQLDGDMETVIEKTVDINTDLTASKQNGGIGLTEPTIQGKVFAGWLYMPINGDVKNVTVSFEFMPTYKYPIESNKEWILGSENNLSIKSDGPFEEFVSVSIDNNILNKQYYTKKEGNTIIELYASYLNTLSEGEHTVEIKFKNSDLLLPIYSATTFEIKKKDSPVEPEKPVVPDNPGTSGAPSAPGGNTGEDRGSTTLLEAVKAIDEIKDNVTFTKNELDIIINAKEAYDKLMVEGNPFELTAKELKQSKLMRQL